jgi:hypothetical protein
MHPLTAEALHDHHAIAPSNVIFVKFIGHKLFLMSLVVELEQARYVINVD